MVCGAISVRADEVLFRLVMLSRIGEICWA